MIIENSKIIEATENELFRYYLKREYDDLWAFLDYLLLMKNAGVKIVEDDEHE